MAQAPGPHSPRSRCPSQVAFFFARPRQPAFIFPDEAFDTVDRDFGRLLPAFFRLLMLFTSEFFFGFFAAIVTPVGPSSACVTLERRERFAASFLALTD